MNRRFFLKTLSLAGATAVVAQDLFAQPKPQGVVITCGPPGPSSFYSPSLEQYIKENAQAEKPIFKISAVWNDIGYEFLSVDVEANDDGYISFTECYHVRRGFSRPADQYALYAPLPGFERVGPWYLLRVISRREARQCRFTIAAPIYTTSDLVPKLSPVVVDLPTAAPGQTHWKLYGPSFVEVGEHYVSRPATVLIDIPESARI